jgi:hypothetical protein
MWERLSDIIKGTVELNLKYSATLLNVSTDYLRNINGILTQAPGSQPAPEPAAPSRPPLLLVGQLNEISSAAFALNNHSEKDVQVTLLVQGELNEKQVMLIPATIALKPGESSFVQIRARIDDALELNRDYHGAVVAPGLSTQSVDFVVRRLPGEAAPAQEKAVPPTAERATSRKRK